MINSFQPRDKDHGTAYVYRDRRIQHRYNRKHDKPSVMSKPQTHEAFHSYNFSSNMKTVQFEECDQWMFSDNKIKSYNHASADIPQQQNCINQPFSNRYGMPRNIVSSQEHRALRYNQKETNSNLKKDFDQQENMNQKQFRSRQNEQTSKQLNLHQVKQSAQNKNGHLKKRTLSATERRRLVSKSSMEMREKRDSFITPTIVSLKLTNPMNIIRKQQSPRQLQKPSPKKLPKKQLSASIWKEKKTCPQKNYYEKLKCAISGWDFDTPFGNDFEQIYSPDKNKQQEYCLKMVQCSSQRIKI